MFFDKGWVGRIYRVFRTVFDSIFIAERAWRIDDVARQQFVVVEIGIRHFNGAAFFC